MHFWLCSCDYMQVSISNVKHNGVISNKGIHWSMGVLFLKCIAAPDINIHIFQLFSPLISGPKHVKSNMSSISLCLFIAVFGMRARAFILEWWRLFQWEWISQNNGGWIGICLWDILIYRIDYLNMSKCHLTPFWRLVLGLMYLSCLFLAGWMHTRTKDTIWEETDRLEHAEFLESKGSMNNVSLYIPGQCCALSKLCMYFMAVDQLSPLLGTDLPATCDGFSPASLLSCQEDINFSDGCCNPECVDALATVSCCSKR